MAGRKRQTVRGAARMYALKRTQVVLWFSEEELRWLDEARLFLKRAPWCKDAVLHAIAQGKSRQAAGGTAAEKVVQSRAKGRNRRR